MNTATKNLEDDHVHILRLIDVMEYIVAHEGSDIAHIESIVEIIRNYADGLHHAKEEYHFFPFLTTKGFSAQHGPVAVMLHEHVLGRDFVKGIAAGIELFRKGNLTALVDIHKNMKGYSDLLRSHIGKENNILFKMADNVLSEEDHHRLLLRFEEAEKELNPSAGSNEYILKINELTSYYEI